MLAKRILSITEEMMALYSPTNTAGERAVEEYLLRQLQQMPYFQQHEKQCGACPVPEDVWQRSCIYGLVLGKSRRTVIYMGHHDVVDTSAYGRLSEIATSPEALRKALAETQLNDEAHEDLLSGKWLFGRGSCDMKGGTAAQLAVLESYAAKPQDGSLLFLSVPDEESFSAGMRGCLPLLDRLRKQYNLSYELAVNCEPNSRSQGVQTVYSGTVGKLLPCVLVQGRPVQIGSYYDGINPVALLAAIVSRTEADKAMIESEGEEKTIPPVWNFMRDFKQVYDFSLPRRAGAYCNVLTFKRQAGEVLDWLQENCGQAAAEVMAKIGSAEQIPVLSYAQLLAKVQKLEGFDEFMASLQKQMQAKRQQDFPSLSLWAMEQVLDFAQITDPIIVIGFAPPFYPSLQSRRLRDGFTAVENFLQQHFPVRIARYFMGISDCSYLGEEGSAAAAFRANTPVWGSLYSFDGQILSQLQIPFLLLGPWGKDLHQRTERVHIESLCRELPEMLQILNRFIWQTR